MDKKIMTLTGAIALCAILGVALLFWGQAGIGSGGGGNPPPRLPDGNGPGDSPSGNGISGGNSGSNGGSNGGNNSISDVFSGSGNVAPPPLPI